MAHLGLSAAPHSRLSCWNRSSSATRRVPLPGPIASNPANEYGRVSLRHLLDDARHPPRRGAQPEQGHVFVCVTERKGRGKCPLRGLPADRPSPGFVDVLQVTRRSIIGSEDLRRNWLARGRPSTTWRLSGRAFQPAERARCPGARVGSQAPGRPSCSKRAIFSRQRGDVPHQTGDVPHQTDDVPQ
jgi:hypothetical protein